MFNLFKNSENSACPSPHGEGGLKSLCLVLAPALGGPSPHGEGGLK